MKRHAVCSGEMSDWRITRELDTIFQFILPFDMRDSEPMIIGIPVETRFNEKRVAATPETVRKLVAAGLTVHVQKDAGRAASFLDDAYRDAGAVIVESAADVLGADVVFKVRAPDPDELGCMKRGAILIGLLQPTDAEQVQRYVASGVTAFAMEWLPRITRAQSMDVLSSQANIAGYKAVILAANTYQRFFPLLMTAAGTVKAARVLILGAGVAGLQAIATAKRLGAVVEAFDVRPATKEQVESLGARFVEVPLSEEERQQAETSGGYAREMTDDYKRRQAELIAQSAQKADVVITTAQIPGKPAPVLVPESTVNMMKPGSVIVDLAVETGGNCPLSKMDDIVLHHGVTIIGAPNLASEVANDASALYARNLLTFFMTFWDAKNNTLAIDRNDEIVVGTLLAMDGQRVEKSA